MAYETWEGSAELTGYGAMEHEDYPISGLRVDDATGERVSFEISEPREVPGPLGSSIYKQDIKLQVSADPARVQEAATEAVLDIADTISFVTDRRIQTSLNVLSKSPSQSGQTEDQSKLFVRRFKGPQDLITVPAGVMAYIAEQVRDTEDDRSLRIARSLRWLRRAYLADDEVEEFAIMMMGLDGLKRLLPTPPKKSGGQKPGINAILKHWAVHQCGIDNQNWKQVWDLRNALFHGELTENTDTRSKLAVATPTLKLALGLALKHVMNLPETAPPHLGLPPFIITGMQITAPPFIPAEDTPPQPPPDEDTGST